MSVLAFRARAATPPAVAPFTVGLTVGHKAAHSVESERHTLLNRHRSLCTITGIAIAHAQADRQALTAYTETQEDLLEIITPIFAMPIGRPGRDKPRNRAALLLIGSIQADRRRILMEPGGRDGIDLQGVECDSSKHAVELRGK